MASFIYAVDKVKTVTNAVLKSAGLDTIFGMVEFTQRHSLKGPGGVECVIFCIGGKAKQLYYRPAEQSWIKSLNKKFWLGFYNENKPKPEELVRAEQIAGHFVELAAGQKWLIPVARMLPEGTCLPQTVLMGPDGQLVKEIIPKFAEFSKKAEDLWDDMKILIGLEKGEIKITERQLWSIAAEALALNYHVGPDEINALKLFTTQNLESIFGAIVDLPAILALQKRLLETEKKKSPAEISDG